MLDQTGYLDLFDDHLDFIIRNLDSEDLPKDEVALLVFLGFPELAQRAADQIAVLAEEWRRDVAPGTQVVREYQRHPASGAIDNAISRIQTHRDERRAARQRRDNDPDPANRATGDHLPRNGPRWWKGCEKPSRVPPWRLPMFDLLLVRSNSPSFQEVRPTRQSFQSGVVSVASLVASVISGTNDNSVATPVCV